MSAANRGPRVRGRVRLVAAALSVLLAACGDAAEPRVEETATPAAPTGARAPSDAGARAPAAPAPARAAEDLPTDLPRYPGAEVSQIGGRGPMLSAVFTTPDGSEQVLAYYEDALSSQGWSTQESSVAGERTLMADKENRFLTIMASPAKPGTKIGILLVER